MTPSLPTYSESNIMGHAYSPSIEYLEKEAGFEDLSASFKSLYKSLFGSMTSENSVPPYSVSGHTTTANLHPTSLPLDVSVNSLLSFANRHSDPQFTHLMDSLRDIADTNAWSKLDTGQVQNLYDSFHAGDQNRFGMEPDMYLQWSQSFNNFLTQLSQTIHHPSSPPSTISSGMAAMPYPGSHPMLHSNSIPHNSMPPPPPYTQPRLHPQPSTIHSSVSPSYIASPHLKPAPTIPGSGPNPPPFQTVATDIFEENEDDDFDWSKLV